MINDPALTASCSFWKHSSRGLKAGAGSSIPRCSTLGGGVSENIRSKPPSDFFKSSYLKQKMRKTCKIFLWDLNILNSEGSDLHCGLQSTPGIPLELLNCLEVHGHIPRHLDKDMHQLSVSKARHNVVILELSLRLCESEDVVSDPFG